MIHHYVQNYGYELAFSLNELLLLDCYIDYFGEIWSVFLCFCFFCSWMKSSQVNFTNLSFYLFGSGVIFTSYFLHVFSVIENCKK